LYLKEELVMVDDYETSEIDIYLAYKFNVYAAKPLFRADVYVYATNGKILLNDVIIKHADANGKNKIAKTIRPTINTCTVHANGPHRTLVSESKDLQAVGDTRYAGRRNFNTTLNENGFYKLKETTLTGIPNETFSFEEKGGIPLNVDFTALSKSIFGGDGSLLEVLDIADNERNSDEHKKDTFDGPAESYPLKNEAKNDDVALDAHWGVEIVLRYWFEIYNRRIYDDEGKGVKNYVHYGDAYDNAFWNGKAMTYGDGTYQGVTNLNGSFALLRSVDFCSHEICHGVSECTADLVYAKESGTMNEGFSDIWAASVENFVLVGIDSELPYITWGVGEQIDERNGGLDKVSVEEQLTDAGNTYNVLSIGFDKADQITCLAEIALTLNATFLKMRDASILATQSLYGVASYEENQVTKAWYAIDIGTIYEAGEPDTVLISKSNAQLFTEANKVDGCSKVNACNIVLIGSSVKEVLNGSYLVVNKIIK
jgi:hypothetical protein